ncbi:hypothetical protein PWT90_01743 [Aphanocladium album]|nr:hypothetical protein PWT90_01743 [Aphanocladium album]
MSPVDSDGDEQPPSSPANEPILKIYGVYNTGTRIKFRVHTGDYDSPCVYYVNSSTFTPGTPDVELRAGDSQDGSVVAFGTFHSLSGNVTMGIGDPEDESGHAIYVELKKESSLVHSDYVFETDLTASTDGKRVTYTWRRNIGKRLFANYSCLDAATGQLVAYFDRAGPKSREKDVAD